MPDVRVILVAVYPGVRSEFRGVRRRRLGLVDRGEAHTEVPAADEIEAGVALRQRR